MPHGIRSHARNSQLISSGRQPSLHRSWPWRHQMETQEMEILSGRMVPPHASQPSPIPLPTQDPTPPSRSTRILQVDLIPCTQQHLVTYIPLGGSHPQSIQQRQRSGSSPTIPGLDRKWPNILQKPQYDPVQRIHSERNLNNPEQEPIPPYTRQSRSPHGV